MTDLVSNVYLAYLRDNNFRRAILHPFFLKKFMQNDKKTIEFVLYNFNDILNLGMHTKEGDINYQNQCTCLLQKLKYPLLTVIFERTNFAAFLTNYPLFCRNFPNISKTIYFNLLPNFIYSPYKRLMAPFAKKEFIASLIELIDLYPAYDFISKLIQTASIFTISVLEKANIANMLVFSLKDPLKMYNALDLLGLCLQGSRRLSNQVIDIFKQDILDTETSHAKIKKIHYIIRFIKNSLLTNDHALITLITKLYIACINSTRGKVVAHDISSFKDEYCSIILNTPIYNQFTESLLDLLINIIENERLITIGITDVTVKLCADFFNFPQKNILHNDVVKLFKTLAITKNLSIDLLAKTKIYDLLYEAYEKKSYERGISYWGQARELATIISQREKDIDKIGGTHSQIWKTKVLTRINKENEILSHEYGGHAHTIAWNEKLPNTLFSWVIITVTFILIMIVFRKKM